MEALEMVGLTPLMRLSSGRPEIAIALIDGPLAMNGAGLWSTNVERLGGGPPGVCTRPASAACVHGTFVAGMLAARRGSGAPAICPGCTLLVRAVFPERKEGMVDIPAAKPAELAQAVVDAADAGARVIN